MELLSPIEYIMSKELVTASKEDSLDKIHRLFKKHPIHHILITDGDKLEGMISKSDLQFFRRGFAGVSKRMESYRLKVHTAKEIMDKEFTTLQASDNILQALSIFKKNETHAIPIVEQEKPIGIITTFDFIAGLLNGNQKNGK